MKHLKIFETEVAFKAAKSNLEQPWVALTEDDENVHFMEGGEPTPTFEYVDLGLPSGLKWAKCNIGATKETDYGLHFQWGATEGYTAEQVASGEKVFDYNTTPYQTNASAGTSYSAAKFTKYLGSETSSFKDPSATDEDALKTVLDPIDDAATQLMGADWRMPTDADFNELLGGTTNAWVTNYIDSGINGLLFSSKTNSNTLFIPAAGNADGSSLNSAGSGGYMWSSSLYASDPFGSRYLNLGSGYCHVGSGYRYDGFSVRGVRK